MSEDVKRFWVYGYLSYFKGFQKTTSVKGETRPEKMAYRTNVVMDPEDPKGKKSIKKCEAMIDHIEQEVGMKPGKFYKLDPKRRCFWKQDTYLNSDDEVPSGYEGMAAVRLSNRSRITFRDIDGKTPLTEEDGKLYSGAYCKVLISGYGIAQSDSEKGGAGIFATVEAIQFLKHGTRFGGGGVSDSDFEDESDNYADDDGEDERPAKKPKKKPVVDDDGEEDEPPVKKPKKKPVVDEEDEEDERPAKKAKKKPAVEDDDEDVEY